MSREHFIGKRAYHRDFDLTGTIVDVHLEVQPQTAKFLPDECEDDEATWVNLVSLKLFPESDGANA